MKRFILRTSGAASWDVCSDYRRSGVEALAGGVRIREGSERVDLVRLRAFT